MAFPACVEVAATQQPRKGTQARQMVDACCEGAQQRRAQSLDALPSSDACGAPASDTREHSQGLQVRIGGIAGLQSRMNASSGTLPLRTAPSNAARMETSGML